MPESEILIGDVCVDLVERGKVQVVDYAADSVEDHRAFSSIGVAEYKANALLDVHDHEPVYRCVYLPENPSISFSGTYDFPRSRLARCPIEDANNDLQRIQDELTMRILAELFQHAGAYDEDLADIASDALDTTVVEKAREFADALAASEVNVDVE